MKKTSKNYSKLKNTFRIKNYQKQNKTRALSVVLLVGLVGTVMFAFTNAAPSTASFQPEDAVLSGSAERVAGDTGASGSASVKFGGTPAVENEFTLAAIPDTQQETITDTKQPQFLVPSTSIYMNQYFNQRLQWMVDNRARLNLKYVWQVGDLQNWDTDTHDQYVRASNGLKILENAGIPYSLANGNHDNMATGVGGSARDTTRTREYFRNVDTWNSFYPVSRFPGMKTLCSEFSQFDTRLMSAYPAGMASTSIDHPQYVKNECTRSDSSVNAYRTFSAGGLKWIIINYEMWPRQVVQEWMKIVLERYPDHNAILITHYHINGGGDIATNSDYGSPQGSPKAVYDRVIKNYPNIKFVSSGHVSMNAACSTSTGLNSSLVHNYLNDRLDGPASGNYFRLIKINVSARTITSEHIMPNAAEVSKLPTNPSSCNETNVNWVR